MALSSDLLSQFAKVTNDSVKEKKESVVYGTAVEYNGSLYVKLDGSDLVTPMASTTDAKPGDRVMVTIKNHTATATGNLTSPAARTGDVQDIGGKVEKFDRVMAHKVTTDNLEAVNGAIDNLYTKVAKIEEMSAVLAEIETLKAKFAEMEYISADNADILNADIENLTATIGQFKDLSTEDFEAINADISRLKAYTADFVYVSAEVMAAVKADIKEAEIKYANIDFSNIGEAAIKKLFSDYGIIEDLVISDGKITGELVGVTIKGDLIEGNTVVADKLVVKGEDGLYYKLNTDGVTTEAEQTDYNSLNGSVITAKSITATKIAVDDLVAFGATIGGYQIRDHELYSGVKESATNTTRGVYFNDEGEFAVGDSNNFLRCFEDEDGTYKLELTADLIKMGGRDITVQEDIDNAHQAANNAQNDATVNANNLKEVQTLVDRINATISMLVTDANGSSLMTQTSEGWTFSTAALQSTVNSLSENLSSLTGTLGSTNSSIKVLQDSVTDLQNTAAYVRVSTYENEPCIHLGKVDSDFKLLITNTRIMFMVGSGVPTYITNTGLNADNIEIDGDLKQGRFVTAARSNGNLGTRWV